MMKPPCLYDALSAAANGYAVVPADGRTGAPLVPSSEAQHRP
jgi:hypothetical protein